MGACKPKIDPNHTIRNPSPAQRKNAARRKVAGLRQQPLHIEGLDFHPATGVLVPGQLDRAASNRKEYGRRYPHAPRYKNHDGTFSN